MKPNLDKIVKDGFVHESFIICPFHISDKSYFLEVYKKGQEYVIYETHEDKIISKYNINKMEEQNASRYDKKTGTAKNRRTGRT